MKKEAQILKALANEKRLEILESLRDGEYSVSELAHMINLHFKSVSKHLQKLTEAGIVERSQQGFKAIYRLQNGVDKVLAAIGKLK